MSSIPMRLVPLSLVVRRTFVSLPFLTGVACAIAAVRVGVSTTTYRGIEKETTAKGKSKEDISVYME